MKEIIITRNFPIHKCILKEPYNIIYDVPKEEISYLSENDIKNGKIFNVWEQEEYDTQTYRGIGILEIKDNLISLINLTYDDIHMPFISEEDAKLYYKNVFKNLEL